ncbi:MAG TPA: hypothetical protein VFG69_21280 [Nannocystaceae bacterium]|nr:hypothetical protein [Nannocystaceae bacterium]
MSSPRTTYSITKPSRDGRRGGGVDAGARPVGRQRIVLLVQLAFSSLAAALASRTLELRRLTVFLALDATRPAGTPVCIRVTISGRPLVLHGIVVDIPRPIGAKRGIAVALDQPVVDESGLFEALLARGDRPREAPRRHAHVRPR